jgi:hypothetical protein
VGNGKFNWKYILMYGQWYLNFKGRKDGKRLVGIEIHHDDVICMLCMLCALKKAKHISEYIFESKQIKTSQRPRLCGPISAMAKNQHPPQPLTPSLPSRILSYSFSPKTKNCVCVVHIQFNKIQQQNNSSFSSLSLSVSVFGNLFSFVSIWV